jgi:hypothetical protein
MPANYQGRWRVRLEAEIKTKNEKNLKDCYINYGELIVD